MAMTPQDFGVVGDGVADDTVDFQSWLTYCGSNDIDPIVGDNLICLIKNTLTFPGASNIDVSRVLFNFEPGMGNYDRPALVVPTAENKTLRFGTIQALTIDWSDDDYVGLRLNDLLSCSVHIKLIAGFNRGYECISTSSGFAYNDIYPGSLWDNKYNEVLRTAGTGGNFVNENTFYSGQYSETSNVNALGDAFGTLLTWDGASSYRGHNNNRWIAPSYEMGLASTTYRVPMLFDGVGSHNSVVGARHESCIGPFAILKGGLHHPMNPDEPNRATHNSFDITFNAAVSGQVNGILEVNGANANICSGVGGEQHSWSSGPISRLLSSAGGASAPYLTGDLFFMDPSDGIPTRVLAGSGQVVTMRDAIQLSTAGVFTAVDTSRIKVFKVTAFSKSGFGGRICVCAFDGAGARLTSDIDDPLGDEPPVKSAYPGLFLSGNYGGGFQAGGDNVETETWFTVREEVKTIYVGFVSGSNVLALQSFEILGYGTDMNGVTGADGKGPMRLFADLDGDGRNKLATAKPDTAGTHGYYSTGDTILNNGTTAATVAAGWQCATAGWLAAAWTSGTSYGVVGTIVTNDGGKMYELIDPGQSAGSGGPTGVGTATAWAGSTAYAQDDYRSSGGKLYCCVTAGTSAASGGPTGFGNKIADGTCEWTFVPGLSIPIVDNTCEWKYIGVKAAFVTLAVNT